VTQVGVDMLRDALHYAALGWAVLPLHTPDDSGVCDCPRRQDCTDSGKHPRTMKGVDAASADEATIRWWWKMWPQANIGIALAPSGLVDIAPDSVEWWAEFQARGLPPTLTFASGAGEGHVHYLYARPEDCPIYRQTESGLFDLMSNGYCVGPPSLHASGRRYRWLPDDELPDGGVIQEAPQWAVEQLGQRAHRRVQDAQQSMPFDPEAPPVVLGGEALERWHGRLYERRPDGTPDRSYSLWRLSVDLLEAGLQPAFVKQLLAERDLAFGWEKFSGRRDANERYHVIVERARASQGPQRVRLNGQVRAEPKRPKPKLEPLTWETIDEFNASVDEEVAWLAVGLVGEGLITELDGKAKRAGKTTLLLSLSCAILRGQSFLGQPTRHSPVVYLTEQSGPSFKHNLRSAGLVDGDAFHILRWNLNSGWVWKDLVPEVLKKVDDVGARLLIIDTLPQFSGVRGDEENRAGEALEVMEPLMVATQRKLAIVISRHDRKSGGEVGDSARGSSAYAGAVDIILHLLRPEAKPGNQRQRVLEGSGRFSDQTPDALLITLGEGAPQQYSVVGSVDDVKTRDMRVDILAAVPDNEEQAIDQEEMLRRVPGRALEVMRCVKELVGEKRLAAVRKPGPKGYPRMHYYERGAGEDDDDD